MTAAALSAPSAVPSAAAASPLTTCGGKSPVAGGAGDLAQAGPQRLAHVAPQIDLKGLVMLNNRFGHLAQIMRLTPLVRHLGPQRGEGQFDHLLFITDRGQQ